MLVGLAMTHKHLLELGFLVVAIAAVGLIAWAVYRCAVNPLGVSGDPDRSSMMTDESKEKR
jgi:hypothetical protein